MTKRVEHDENGDLIEYSQAELDATCEHTPAPTSVSDVMRHIYYCSAEGRKRVRSSFGVSKETMRKKTE